MLHRNNSELNFDVYRKATNKNNLVNFYSNHSDKIKSGIMMGFYLRALRICGHQYLPKEETHIENTFKNLQYPYHFIHNTKRKAYKIHDHNKNDIIHNNKLNKNRYIILGTNSINPVSKIRYPI